MKPQEIEYIRDCFDGTTTRRILFDFPFKAPLLAALHDRAEVRRFKEFPKPFFSIKGSAGYHAQGVEGELSVTLTVPQQGQQAVIDAFLDDISMAFREGRSM